MQTVGTLNYSVEYAFTVTLNRRFNELTTDSQIENMNPWLYNYMLAYGRDMKHYTGRNMLITSVLELTQNANIHVHGIVRYPMEWLIKNVNIWFRDMFRPKKRQVLAFGIGRETDKSQYFGFVNIKPCDNLLGWTDYLRKNFKEFLEATGRRPIMSDDFMCFGTEEILLYHN